MHECIYLQTVKIDLESCVCLHDHPFLMLIHLTPIKLLGIRPSFSHLSYK